MILGACSILTMPALGSITLCWMISFVMLITGIVSIVRYIEDKNAEKVAEKAGIPHFNTGIESLLFGLASIVVSILARNSAIGEAVFVQIVSVLFGLWIVLYGVSMLVLGSGMKHIALPGWLATMIVGILLVISGVFCIIDCFMSLTAMGVMLGISMMMAGFAFILI